MNRKQRKVKSKKNFVPIKVGHIISPEEISLERRYDSITRSIDKINNLLIINESKANKISKAYSEFNKKLTGLESILVSFGIKKKPKRPTAKLFQGDPDIKELNSIKIERYNLVNEKIIFHYLAKLSKLEKLSGLKENIDNKEKLKLVTTSISYLKKSVLSKIKAENYNRPKFNENKRNNYVIANLIVASVENLEILTKMYGFNEFKLQLAKIRRSEKYRIINSYKFWGELEEASEFISNTYLPRKMRVF